MNASLSIAQCVEVACILEVTARKPGNVHRARDFAATGLLDFLLSAQAIGPALEQAAVAGVGATLLEGMRQTRRFTSTNTNLGILLLLTPLAAAPRDMPMSIGVRQVLNGLTVGDSALAYEAIRLAEPGSLGEVADQDVRQLPTIDLRAAMLLAADRDLVARQYAYDFEDVFQFGVPVLLDWLARPEPAEEAIIACHLRWMARHPDSLIARKRGADEAMEAAARAGEVLEAGWPATESGRARFAALDQWLRAEGNQRNPGTSADLVTACLFVALREDRMNLPLDFGWTSKRVGSLSQPATP